MLRVQFSVSVQYDKAPWIRVIHDQVMAKLGGTHAMLSGVRLMLSLLVLLGAASWGRGEEWANLRGQIVFDGEPPEPKKLKITKDEEECCKHNLVDESIKVHPENHGLQNVVVYLYPAADKKVPVHPSYDGWAAEGSGTGQHRVSIRAARCACADQAEPGHRQFRSDWPQRDD